MMAKRSGPVAALTALGLLLAFPLAAQDFSPYLETTSHGAYDQYRDALLCNAVLEREIETAPETERRSQLEKGVHYTRNFAQFLLESGNVVDPAGTILAPDDLPIAQANAQGDWETTIDTLGDKGETVEAEIVRCLRLYGHVWE